MSTNTEVAGSKLDVVKIVVAIAIIAAAITGFYMFREESTLLRVVALLAAVGIAGWIFLQTTKGRSFWQFFHDAQVEVRKVVWPTRQETTQTTLLVIGTVIVAALFFWGLDAVLGKLVRLVIGG